MKKPQVVIGLVLLCTALGCGPDASSVDSSPRAEELSSSSTDFGDGSVAKATRTADGVRAVLSSTTGEVLASYDWASATREAVRTTLLNGVPLIAKSTEEAPSLQTASTAAHTNWLLLSEAKASRRGLHVGHTAAKAFCDPYYGCQSYSSSPNMWTTCTRTDCVVIFADCSVASSSGDSCWDERFPYAD